MYLLTNVITMLMATSTFSFSASMFRVHKCACIIKFHVAEYTYENGVQFEQIFAVVETVFFHSI